MVETPAPTPTTVPEAPTSTPAPAVGQGVSFARDVLPVLVQSCSICHGGTAGLFLDSYENVMRGGASGPEVVPGNPDASPIIRRVRGIDQPRMPLGGPFLSDAQIDLIAAWIADGALNN